MPELFSMFGMRFFFFGNDHLPIRVHVKNSDGEARFEVENVRLIESKDMKLKDLTLAEALVEDRKEEIIAKWREFLTNNLHNMKIKRVWFDAETSLSKRMSGILLATP